MDLSTPTTTTKTTHASSTLRPRPIYSAMQHRFSYQIECGYDNDISVSNLPNADQIMPYAADQTFCLKLSHALIFF